MVSRLSAMPRVFKSSGDGWNKTVEQAQNKVDKIKPRPALSLTD